MTARIAVLFGGGGYIGEFLTRHFLQSGRFDRIVVADVQAPACTGHDGEVQVVRTDVRQPIELELADHDPQESWIFNLAAVHREPGHERREYFDTNVSGAEHVCLFARHTGIRNVFFTSSIAPYGPARDERHEGSPLYPETPYGISKALAEQIHRVWMAEAPDRRLVTCRPAVIYGPGDPGNILRMIQAIRDGWFVFPGPRDIVKAYGYVHGLLDSVDFVLDRRDREILYNYCEHPLLSMRELVSAIQRFLGRSSRTLSLPTPLVSGAARIVSAASRRLGRETPLHPVRVRKAAFPTHIRPKWLLENGFSFRYPFEESLTHWRAAAPEDFGGPGPGES